MIYNIGENKVIKKLFRRENDIKLPVDISGKDQYKKDLELPLLETELHDDKYFDKFIANLQHIENEYHGKIYYIRCGIKTERIVKAILDNYDIKTEVMVMYEKEYNVDDWSDNNYCRTDILFKTDIISDELGNLIRIPETKIMLSFAIPIFYYYSKR